ncbi:Proteolipid membrane potential modulator [Lasallia pustulata]|uniref:Proteolipid membrane potential modulator n=1 Tax=Lasallia pustulata TaxID=136370 RepID=A0A1W5CZS1_9LECA|nr:Proteolipid membrane potential modulator [Lasallia pustulata]
MCSSDIFLGLIAILFPPIAVWIKRGLCSADSLINLALCCLGFIPGLLHAWYIIARYPEAPDSAYERAPPDGGENGHVTYYYVAQRGGEEHRGGQGQRGGDGRAHGGYGTVGESMRVGGRGEGAQPGGSAYAGAVPPSYEQAVGADNKVQT